MSSSCTCAVEESTTTDRQKVLLATVMITKASVLLNNLNTTGYWEEQATEQLSIAIDSLLRS